jgi:hypothetical protein
MALTQVAAGLLAGSITSSQITSVAASTLTGTQTLPRGTLPTGSVLQVIQSGISASISTTSTSYVTSGLSASITPSSASNKVLAVLSGGGQYGAAGGTKNNQTTIYRNAVNLGSGSENSLSRLYIVTAEIAVPQSISILDSPSTTSSTTYTAYFKAVGGVQVHFNVGGDSGVVTLTLMEISA